MSVDELEDLEDFRHRARSWIGEHLPAARPIGMTLRNDRSDEEELASVARDREVQRMLFDAGLAGICFPRAYGGQGLSPAHQQALNEELAGHEFPMRLQIPTLSPCTTVLLEFGNEEQKQRHIPAILKGDEIWMQFLSEPSGGSDVAGALTTAIRDGDEWVLNGSKIWTTGAWWSDWALCLARTNWDVPKHRGLTVFMVPIRQPSIDLHRIEMLNGNREFCQEFLTEVRIPDSDRIGEVDQGWTVGTRWMFHERMSFNSPFVTMPPRATRGGPATTSAFTVARDAGRLDDPTARDLVGEARDARGGRPRARTAAEPRYRHRRHVRPGVRDRPSFQWPRRYPAHDHRVRAGGWCWRGVDRRGRRRGRLRHRLPDAAGRMHRRRDHRDGAQRRQRTGARYAPRANARP